MTAERPPNGAPAWADAPVAPSASAALRLAVVAIRRRDAERNLARALADEAAILLEVEADAAAAGTTAPDRSRVDPRVLRLVGAAPRPGTGG